jgi:hypothetical protein
LADERSKPPTPPGEAPGQRRGVKVIDKKKKIQKKRKKQQQQVAFGQDEPVRQGEQVEGEQQPPSKKPGNKNTSFKTFNLKVYHRAQSITTEQHWFSVSHGVVHEQQGKSCRVFEVLNF